MDAITGVAKFNVLASGKGKFWMLKTKDWKLVIEELPSAWLMTQELELSQDCSPIIKWRRE